MNVLNVPFFQHLFTKIDKAFKGVSDDDLIAALKKSWPSLQKVPAQRLYWRS
jgi:hypothetical protein